MNATESAGTTTPSLGHVLPIVARYCLGGRRGFLLLAGVVVVGGLVPSWGWLVAAGIAPLLLAVAPCVAMCALGLCMHRMSGGARAAETEAETQLDSRQLALDLGGREAAFRPASTSARPIADQRVASCCKPR